MRALAALTFTVLVVSHDAAAADRLCDTAFEDCRAPLLELIRNERVGGCGVLIHGGRPLLGGAGQESRRGGARCWSICGRTAPIR